ncbi:restriction endonuclease subunit S [Desulfonatronum thiodismutans]|uniref:restriction endonuclease subunit S n=1 Tax=Desulfonatronum thiodismutans TaxID=159290 RepID=UPI0004DB6BA3|nr:restriction endonuclease subunit S [Desulfonatronum thiodismutans]
MNTKLTDVTVARGGFATRKEIVEDPQGNIRMVLPMDVQPDKPIDYNKLRRIRVEGIGDVIDKHLLRPGEILFYGRMGKRVATLVDQDVPKNVVASQLIVVLSIISRSILPDFLAMYLNSEYARGYFAQVARGAHPMVSMRALQRLPVPMPSLEEQQEIASMWRGWQERKQKLFKEIAEEEMRVRLELEKRLEQECG